MLRMSGSDAQALLIEAIDNYHHAWPMVLEIIRHSGKEQEIQLESDGWLPARLVLLAGFFQTQVAGFICFNIVPKINSGKLSVDAHIASMGVSPEFADADVATALLRSAHQRAAELNCQNVVRLAA